MLPLRPQPRAFVTSSLLAACISGFPAFAENDGKREVRKAALAITMLSCLPQRLSGENAFMLKNFNRKDAKSAKKQAAITMLP